VYVETRQGGKMKERKKEQRKEAKKILIAAPRKLPSGFFHILEASRL
jgi:hypothetical protein